MINSRLWMALIHVLGGNSTLQDDRAVLSRHFIWELISGITVLISHGFRRNLIHVVVMATCTFSAPFELMFMKVHYA